MMKMDLDDYAICKNNKNSLKELSRDSSDPSNIQYMTHSQLFAVDFDAVKTEYVNGMGLSEECASSCDALIHTKKGIAFIEFKNGSMKNEKSKVKEKIRDSLLIFCDIVRKDISFTRECAEFVLVYNAEKNPIPNQFTKDFVQASRSRRQIMNYIVKKSGKEPVFFDLDKFRTLYFKEVHTYSPEEFEEYIANIG